MGYWGLFIIVLLVGGLLPLQAGVNSSLAKVLGSSAQAGIISFIGGFILMAIFCLVRQQPLISFQKISNVSPHLLLGGLLGGIMVITAILVAPRIGAVAYVVCLVAGQIIASIILDHNGWVGFRVHPINTMRLVGIAFLVSGLFLVHKY